MMPLLAIYANLFGVLGGAVVGVGVLGISPVPYYQQSLQFIGLHDMAAGVVKAVVFGVLVGLAGCLQRHPLRPRRCGGRGRRPPRPWSAASWR